MKVRSSRIGSSLLAAVLLSAASPVLLPAEQAAAAPGGRACFFRDAQGANGAGHVAWAIRDPRNSQRWIWGSTDNAEGDLATLPGRNNGSWMRSGSWDALRASLKPDPGRTKFLYDAYRCINTAGGNLAAAERTFRSMRDNGYQIAYNNCLTKAISIFRAYSPALSKAHLPNGGAARPNSYFGTTLTKHARGWEMPHTYTPIHKK
ncbi:Tat pathway signal protein [Streptomyces sp. NPDC050388]|uniref:Tat pathway signal protein n=1 Tax=Streptomyces sp. NPDC050388 TaxID=3155781 RepID=UPI003440B682